MAAIRARLSRTKAAAAPASAIATSAQNECWKPDVTSAAVGRTPCGNAEVKIVVAIATPIAPPTCWLVLRRPDATPASEALRLAPDGLFLSNGPGDPAAVPYAAETTRELLAAKKPLFGICLGHQILGLALGGRTYKLKFGHHGANQPVMDLGTGKVEITSQNHNFAVDVDSLAGKAELSHVNLNDRTVEGMRLAGAPVFSVQYHPEASPGPRDSHYLFKRFADLMRAKKSG